MVWSRSSLMRQPLVLLVACLAAADGANRVQAAEAPLHQVIDRLVESRAGKQPLAPMSDDAEFLRRVMLDLAGRIPTVAEALRFLGETAADKRFTLIDSLLSGDDYPRRMQELFHVMLMERRGEHAEWTKFLRYAFNQNLPWDRVARAMLSPDATDENLRGAAYFLTARLTKEGAMAPVDVPGLTRDVGRLMAGVDFGCAQCHDHVSIEDYKQVDFQGLHMIFENMQSRGGEFPAVTEKVMTKPREFKSVFTRDPRTTPLRIPGAGDVSIRTFPKGEEYSVAPDRKAKRTGVLKFSPLRELAGGLATGKNPLFARNIVNRLWFVMMGRGLVEPLDLFHSANPPTHPELLDRLAGEFVSHKFDIKWLLGQLARTRCYQRSSRLPGDQPLPPRSSYTVANQKRLSAEQLFWSTLVATGEIDRVKPATDDTLEKVVARTEPLVELQKQFLKTFSNPPKEPEVDFAPTVKGALYLMHDQAVLDLVKPRPGNLVTKLAAEPDTGKLSEALFLAVVSRGPTTADVQVVAKLLENKTGAARIEAIGQLAWALLASTEFCLNH